MIRARSEWVVRKRDGRVVPFDDGLIGRAIANAFRAELNFADGQPLDEKTDQEIREITEEISATVAEDAATDHGSDVEAVQDTVELLLMKRGHYRVARRYIVYRAEHE
ncbi:MAG: ribonucleoside-diphosphate reductase subunit alpha, partial [Fuerstiella sp.]|nr:ribonucleoside-diphosphate reductase subunit alpha [Fuerstiella sp.]